MEKRTASVGHLSATIWITKKVVVCNMQGKFSVNLISDYIAKFSCCQLLHLVFPALHFDLIYLYQDV